MFGLGAVAGILTAVPIVGGLIAPLASFAGLVLIVYEIYNVVAHPSGRRWGDRLGNTRVIEAGETMF